MKKKQAVSSEKAPMTYCETIQSPLGPLLLAADDTCLTGLYFADCKHVPAASKTWKQIPRHPILRQTAGELKEYFVGKRKIFSIPVRFVGTPFQEKVWQQISRIPHGKTVTYSDLASRSGKPDAIRAAGTATGRNPISIIVPCHRIVGKDGSLHGFAGGLERKKFLLTLEK